MESRNVENCIAGRLKRWQFPEPQGDGLVTATYSFLFSPTAIEHRVARTFPAPRYTGEVPTQRSDFRHTIHWEPQVKTDERGRATVSFHLSDAITTFRVTAEGVGGGLAGRGESTLASTLPFSLYARLPRAVQGGDRIH